MANPPELRFSLDELEHQALDTLDSIPLGLAWKPSQLGVDAVPTEIAAAIEDAGEDVAEVEAAIETARRVLTRLVAIMAERLWAAAEVLAATDDRGAIDLEAITHARADQAADPELALAQASAVESVGVALGLDRASLAWAVLIDLGERASGRADELSQTCSRAIAERLTAAQASATTPPSLALRVFRSAAVTAAGPEVRARFLAADHPEQLALARALVEAISDPATLVDQFDHARAALAEANPTPEPSPEAAIDGPKRKFTPMHLILAVIILGLTVWHYVLRAAPTLP